MTLKKSESVRYMCTDANKVKKKKKIRKGTLYFPLSLKSRTENVVNCSDLSLESIQSY